MGTGWAAAWGEWTTSSYQNHREGDAVANRDQKKRQATTNKPKVSTKEKQQRKAAKISAKRDTLHFLPG